MLELTEIKSNKSHFVNEKDAIISHVRMIHRIAENNGARGRIVVASYGENPATGKAITPKVKHFAVGDVKGSFAFIERIRNDPYRNVYMSLVTMRSDLPQGKKGEEKDIEMILGFVPDFDDARASEYEKRLPVPPDLVLETSNGRFQTPILFKTGLSVEQAKPLAIGLCKVAGCDHGTKDLSHVWRVPGCKNWPNKRKVDAGRSSNPQIVTVHKGWSESFTDVALLKNALPVVKSEDKSNIISTSKTPVPVSTKQSLSSASTDLEVLIDIVNDNLAEDSYGIKFELIYATMNGESFVNGKYIVGNEFGFDHEDRDKFHYYSPSQRDLGLCNYLVRYCGNDMPDKDKIRVVDEYIRRLPIYRPKWDEIRGSDGSTYGEITLRKAIEGLHENAQDTPKSKNTSSLILVHIKDVRLRAPDYLIKPYLETDTLSLSFGDPGCGKSFFAVDMAACIATGVDFHGFRVKPGPVVYIAGEGQSGIGRRFLAWSIVRKVDHTKAPIFLSLKPVGLSDTDQASHLIKAVQTIAAQSGPPVLIVVDTVARNFGPGNENDTADMTKFIAAADDIRSQYHSAVHLVHHTGHSDKKRARGSIALKGALDSEYRIEKDKDGIVHVTATKMKDARIPDPMAFKFRGVDLPFVDDDGDCVTSAVLERIHNPVPLKAKKEKGLGRNQRKSLGILKKLYEDSFLDTIPAHALRSGCQPSQADAPVSIDRWREACLHDGLDSNAFWRVKDSLEKAGRIETDIHNVYMIA